MNEFSFRLIHDRPNQRLKLVRISTGNFQRKVLADIPLSSPIMVKRLDGGQTEIVKGRRTFTLIWGEGESQKASLTAMDNLSIYLEDEATLVTLDDGSAYDFSYIEATPFLAGDELQEILERIIRQTGFRSLRYGILFFDNAVDIKAINDADELSDFLGGGTFALPPDAVGASMSFEGAATTDTIRFVTSGSDDPNAGSQLGHLLYDKDIVHIGRTPETPSGDIQEIQGAEGFRAVGNSIGGDAILHITFWALQ